MDGPGPRTYCRWALALQKGYADVPGDVVKAVEMLRKSVDNGVGDFREAYLELAQIV